MRQANILASAFEAGARSVVHLVSLPGGAAEADPDLSFAVNVEASLTLMGEAARRLDRPRFVYSSSIAVFGDPLPEAGVDDATPLRPRLIYGLHKRMVEDALATLTRRGELDAVGLRLPGIVARPEGAAGLKSAFMSDVFHAIAAGRTITLPVSRQAEVWLMSVQQTAACLAHAVSMDTAFLPEDRVVTLPALRVTMEALVVAIAAANGQSVCDVRYQADEALEAAFGRHPILSTPAAERAGFRHDGSVEALVRRALEACGAQPG